MRKDMTEKLMARIHDNIEIWEISIFRHWIMALSAKYGLCCYIPDSPGIEMPPIPDGFDMANPQMESWEGRDVREAVAELLPQNDILSRSTGLALLNSVLPDPDGIYDGESQLFFEEKARHLKTCFIGHFRQAAEWREKGFPVTIVELDPKPGDIHWNDAAGVLGECDMVFITGLTLINDTFEQVIDLTPKAKERILFGPTVPFCDFWFDYGITTVGSTRILMPDLAREFFAANGSSVSRAPFGALKKVNISRGVLCG
ncbi:DUF364 domain-containing protein [Desulforegula conservatrix]|uniref:DUF364 domain-containing protein n=1 Tax=Desulforegula conservatrix TaxID=153026 RepID=UPI000422B27C|nr:DUF364 domain-containing protein [Desulforegula conservatrix]